MTISLSFTSNNRDYKLKGEQRSAASWLTYYSKFFIRQYFNFPLFYCKLFDRFVYLFKAMFTNVIKAKWQAKHYKPNVVKRTINVINNERQNGARHNIRHPAGTDLC